MRRWWFGWWLLVLMLSASESAHAGVFRNRFLEFETPAYWACGLEGTEWVCQDSRPDRKKESIIVLAAKERGPQDSLEAYRDHLVNPKVWRTDKGRQLTSKVLGVKTVLIKGHAWVDATHDESEVPGFRTRYLATLRERIAVLVTYSIAKERYDERAPEFDAMLKTLNILSPGSAGAGGARAGAGNDKGQAGAVTGGQEVASSAGAGTSSTTSTGSTMTTSTGSTMTGAAPSKSCTCLAAGTTEAPGGVLAGLLVPVALLLRRARGRAVRRSHPAPEPRPAIACDPRMIRRAALPPVGAGSRPARAPEAPRPVRAAGRLERGG